MPLQIAALSPLSVGTLAWRDAAGVLQLTVVAKATFEIRPDHRARIAHPYPLFGDVYFEENEGRSLRVASDFAPHKPSADVLFTGAAYAPIGERVTHRSVRLAVMAGSTVLVDKKLLAVGSRERDKGGTPTAPQPFAHLPLRWELAYGGASSRANPIGIGEDPGDTRLPSIVDPADPRRAAGLGPIPSSWWARREKLGAADPAVLAAPVPMLRAGIDLAFFNAAPHGQQIAELQGDEQVVMTGLHPAWQEMTWRLPGVRAHAVVELGGQRRTVPLRLDTLWIEGETMRAALTWRGALALEAAEGAQIDSGVVMATLAAGSAAPDWEPRRGPRAAAPVIVHPSSAPEAASVMAKSSSIELEMDRSMIFAPKGDDATGEDARSADGPRIPPRVSANVPIVNDTGLFAWVMPWQVRPPEYAVAVVVKATYLVGEDGALALAPEQEPPSGDVEYEPDEAAPGSSSLHYASDFAIFKPAADVLLVGHAYPPDAAVGVTNVELRVGDLRRRLAVFGDRKWGGFGFEGQPARFDKLPLRWERAIGGPLSEDNPLGRGYKTGVLAPNLERPEALARTRDDKPPPACFAPVPPGWKLRRSKTGSFDASWLRERWPYLPADFDWSYFNAAPPEQQVPYLRGDERFAVIGVRPGGKGFEGRLPGARPRVFALRTQEAGGEVFEILLRLDTLWIDADSSKLVLVWRGLYSTPDEDSPDITTLFVDVEQGDVVRPLDRMRERILARVASTAHVAPAALAFPDEAPTRTRDAARRLPKRPAAPARADVLAKIAAGVSLAGSDLTGVDLNGLDLSGANLAGAILAHAKLADAVFDRAKLAGAVLTGAHADRASFVDADLAGADLTGARLHGAKLDRAGLTGAVLDGVRGSGASVLDAGAERASFVGARLDEARLDRARLSGADFSRATLERASFCGATLDDVRLYDARGEGARFEGASMPRSRADGACLKRASFARVAAPQSVWERADLTGASFAEAALTGAQFPRATLEQATFTKANATGAAFRRANLRRARCLQANLMQANFERADLSEADLRGANLYQAETWRAKTNHADLASAHMVESKLARRS
jgi:uncharacterized protein YjbI with pentapeptide repeats